ncbi:hypothetical protein [Enterobacter phage 03_vB_Eclo_IJM]|nr:hypothetical protein [Enterobacter phage 03_vB_Eclo_IJM]
MTRSPPARSETVRHIIDEECKRWGLGWYSVSSMFLVGRHRNNQGD